jgi:pimeloyl-ACP methyl ester carboxylesterase
MKGESMTAATHQPTPEGPGSVSGAPNLPDGFTESFSSRYVEAGGLRQHVVVGGEGPPLLLVHGWPQTWYAWRHVMSMLAADFEVIAPDQRGIGLTDKPEDGYDPATLADDLASLMEELGHERFAVVGTDTGLPISYALAADHRDRIERVGLGEVPGPPGAVPSPPFFVPEPLNNRLWHIAVNRLDQVNEQLVTGREDIYFGYEFDIQAGKNKLPAYLVDYYVGLLRDPDSLHGSFAFYREWDTMVAQNEQRKDQPLEVPVLAISGEDSWGEAIGDGMKAVANEVQTAVIPGAGHWYAEQAPQETVAALTEFLAPYLKGAASATSAPA